MTPGNETSEFSLTKLIMLAGGLLDALGILLQTLESADFHFGWLPVALVVVGTLSMVAAKLGYTSSRTQVKIAESNASAAQSFDEDRIRRLVADLQADQLPRISIVPPPQPPNGED